MPPKNGERPPPSRDDDLSIAELPTRALADKFNASRSRSQGATRIPRARLARLAGRLHSLGPRPLLEFLVEIEAGAPLIPRLERYAALASPEPFAA